MAELDELRTVEPEDRDQARAVRRQGLDSSVRVAPHVLATRHAARIEEGPHIAFAGVAVQANAKQFLVVAPTLRGKGHRLKMIDAEGGLPIGVPALAHQAEHAAEGK